MAGAMKRPKQAIVNGLFPFKRVLEEDFARAFAAVLRNVEGFDASKTRIVLAPSKFGDYQCNNVIGFWKQHRKSLPHMTNEKELAEAVKAELDPAHYKEIKIAGPGYITVDLDEKWLASIVVEKVLQKDKLICEVESLMKVAVDYSSPNIAKEMHAGHLRSTIHGETLCRVFEFVGHKVSRLNHLGDWGTQFGMLISHLQDEYPNYSDSPPNLGDLNIFYRQAKERFDVDETFKDRARKMVVTLQAGDPAARAAWKMLVQVSMTEFSKVYKRLGVSGLEEFGESYYNEMLPSVVDKCKAAGFVEEAEGGCMCVFSKPKDADGKRKYEVPLMLVKSDGGFGYDSTDVAAVYHRLCEVKYDCVLYVTDRGQEEHFLKLFDFAQRMGWHKPPATRLDHCGLGLVCGDDGKKFKSRGGDVVKLVDLLDEAVRRAREELVLRRGGETSSNLEEAAAVLGYAAVRYFDMSQVRTGNYKFSYEKILDPKGNTAVYLLYAYARICSIQDKAATESPSNRTGDEPGVAVKMVDTTKFEIENESQRKLVFHILTLPDTLEQVLDDMSSHHICDYAYQCAVLFSEFYHENRILDSENRQSRLLLCAAVKKCLGTALFLLGITPLERI